MGQDRRRHTRFPRLIEVTFPWEGRLEHGVSTDVSVSGAFISTGVSLPVGAPLCLRYRPFAHEPPIELIGAVRRSIGLDEHTLATGAGMQWDKIRTDGSLDLLRGVLSGLFQTQVRVRPDRNGGAIWLASQAPGGPDRLRSDVIERDVAALMGAKGQGEAGQGMVGLTPGAEIECFTRGLTTAGRIVKVGPTSFTTTARGPVPEVGDVLVCFHRLGDERAAVLVRLVGVVSQRTAGPMPGFSVHVIRVDLPREPSRAANSRRSISVVDDFFSKDSKKVLHRENELC